MQLARASTYHRRKAGPSNAFRYSVDYVLCDMEADARLPWFMSRNRRNLASVWDRDHGGERGAGTGAAWVRRVLDSHNIGAQLAACRILLLAQPRMAGYLFNPVSFWLVTDEDDTVRAFIAEVNNTMGDRHSYLCHHTDLRPIRPEDTMTARKVFHVSPFQEIKGTYRFNLTFKPDSFMVRIDLDQGERGFLATLTGTRLPLTSARILHSALRRPLGSLRVVALIHWQAVKLLIKGAPFKKRPLPPSNEVST